MSVQLLPVQTGDIGSEQEHETDGGHGGFHGRILLPDGHPFNGKRLNPGLDSQDVWKHDAPAT
jgi:hypothetical protein